ncbi:MAG: MBL fold metallo-hydrolase [Desulfonatronovibrionaceae bacterium]
MKAVFVGVGEAFDQNRPNTSILLQSGGMSLILDCGFSAPAGFWNLCPHPLDLDAVWISHLHGDHFFGLPQVLLRFYEQGREKALTVAGGPGLEKSVKSALDLAYPGVRERIKYRIDFLEVSPGAHFSLSGFACRTAAVTHAVPALSLRVADGRASVFYSGDGRATPESAALAEKCDLIIHEAFGLDPVKPDHGSVRESIDFAVRAKAKTLALVHVQRDVRREKEQRIRELLVRNSHPRIILPEAGEVLEV